MAAPLHEELRWLLLDRASPPGIRTHFTDGHHLECSTMDLFPEWCLPPKFWCYQVLDLLPSILPLKWLLVSKPKFQGWVFPGKGILIGLLYIKNLLGLNIKIIKHFNSIKDKTHISYISINTPKKHLTKSNTRLLKMFSRASLVAQWLRIRLPMQATRVPALVQEDPICRGATKPVRHNYWACALEPASHNYWSPCA